jgi:FkbM family methyltransferase
MFENIGVEEIKYLNYSKGKIGDSPTLLDVGFNRGYFTDAFLYYYPISYVYGFEPIEELYDISVTKYADNANVKIINCGLSNCERNSVPMFYLQNGFDGMSSLHYRPKYYPKFNVKTVQVKLKMLDNYLNDFHNIEYIKCDTEGHELFFLQGAENFLERLHPKFIQFEVGECYNDSGTTFRQVIDFLYRKSYIVLNRDFMQITPENVWENYDCQNYLAEYFRDL